MFASDLASDGSNPDDDVVGGVDVDDVDELVGLILLDPSAVDFPLLLGCFDIKKTGG